jgi:hypothetical protein
MDLFTMSSLPDDSIQSFHASSAQQTYHPLDLTIRFAASLPDLRVPVFSAQETSAISLIPRIRSNLPKDYANLRIRLIYLGRVLPLQQPLSTSLRLPSTTKLGKAPARVLENDYAENGENENTELKLYIHASFGDALSAEELSLEAENARRSVEALTKHTSSSNPLSGPHDSSSASNNDEISSQAPLPPPPQGFDRLITAGLTPQEISTLRSDFRSLVSAHHTADTMPSSRELLGLEDRWLDEASVGNSELLGALTGQGVFGDGVDGGHGLEDMFWGNVIGFFWPVGAFFWLFQEDGVWREQKQIAVFIGVFVNLFFCLIRVAGLGAGA